MIKSSFAYLSFILIVMFSSCISSEETNYLQSIPKNYELVSFHEYKINIRDELLCNITTVDKDLRSNFSQVISSSFNDGGIALTVYEDGNVIIPFFGMVQVLGMTIQDAEVKIQNHMKQYIIDAQVKLQLRNNYFYVYANDKRGAFRVYKENMTIYQALAISGQTTNKMDLTQVKIIRTDTESGIDYVKTFDLRSQDVIQSDFYFIQPNDVIYFPTHKKSFFNITSVQSFISVVMTPLMFLFVTLKLKN